jgi:hypothetical protein
MTVGKWHAKAGVGFSRPGEAHCHTIEGSSFTGAKNEARRSLSAEPMGI